MPLAAPQELRTYFITAVTANRRRLFQVEEKAQLLIDTLTLYRSQGRFQLHAFVVMPDHLHALLTPAPEVSLEKAMQYIKGGFSFRLKSKLDVWSRGFNETQIRTYKRSLRAERISKQILSERICAPLSNAMGSRPRRSRRPWMHARGIFRKSGRG